MNIFKKESTDFLMMDDHSKPPSVKSVNTEDTVIITKNGVEIKSVTNVQILEKLSKKYTATEKEKKYYGLWVKDRTNENKYRIQGKIVTGGMGAIYRVMDEDLQRTSAMKVILPELKNDLATLKHFIREAKLTAFLEHPNIIPVHEIGLLPETGIYFTMKLARGESLKNIIQKIKKGYPQYVLKYNLQKLLNIFRKVCDAVAFAHSRRIIHHDIKPHNIMVGKFGEVLLMDWGLSHYIGDPEKEYDPLIKKMLKNFQFLSVPEKQTIKGSPAFMSPEQVKGDPGLLSERTDIFLLGATLYHIFTLSPPYEGKDIYEVLHKAQARNLVSPDKKNPTRKIPEELSRIIQKAMSFHPKDRYSNVEELIEDLENMMTGQWTQKETRFFKAGDILMKEGETGNSAYMILSGRVKILKKMHGRNVVLDILKEGDMVGEMSLITKETRTATAVAVMDTEAAVLSQSFLNNNLCLIYTTTNPRDKRQSRIQN